MGIRASFQRMIGIVMAWSSAGRVLTLSVLLFVWQACAAQQQPPGISANLQQVETLVQQGRLDEARTQMLVELQRNPASVDGYNLLGIIDSD